MRTCCNVLATFGLLLATKVERLEAQGSLTPSAGPAPSMKSLDQINPGRAIPSLDPSDVELGALPYRITAPGRYYLAANIEVDPSHQGHVIEIASSHVQLDLSGHRIHRSVYPEADPTAILLTTDGALENIVIANGMITGHWHVGIERVPSEFSSRNVAVTDMHLAFEMANGVAGIRGDISVVRDCTFEGLGVGVFLEDHAEVEDCVFLNCALRAGNGARVSRCLMRMPVRADRSGSRIAMQLGRDALVEECAIRNADFASSKMQEGIVAGIRSRVKDCVLLGARGDGVALGAQGWVSHSVVVAAARSGIDARDPDLVVADSLIVASEGSGIQGGDRLEVRRCAVVEARLAGIAAGERSRVTDSWSTQTLVSPGTASAIHVGTDSMVSGSFVYVSDARSVGLFLGLSSLASGNWVYGGQRGLILSEHSSARGNVVMYSRSRGISCGASTEVIGNDVIDVDDPAAGGSSGIEVAFRECVIDHNFVSTPGVLGIDVFPANQNANETDNVIRGNVSLGFGNPGAGSFRIAHAQAGPLHQHGELLPGVGVTRAAAVANLEIEQP